MLKTTHSKDNRKTTMKRRYNAAVYDNIILGWLTAD